MPLPRPCGQPPPQMVREMTATATCHEPVGFRVVLWPLSTGVTVLMQGRHLESSSTHPCHPLQVPSLRLGPTGHCSAADFDGQALLSSVGKGRPVQAIVEAVNSGSTLRVTLLPSLQSATIMVAGVQCPSMGRRPAAAPAEGADSAAAVAAAAPEAAPEPFAREAKYYTELRTLNKEVTIVLEGVSQVSSLR